MQNTCPKGSQTEGRQSAWQESVLCGGLPFCFWYFLLNSTDNFGYWWAVLAKKVPHSRMFIGDWLHDDRTKQRFMSVASPMKCEALVLFDVNVCYTYTQHVQLHPLETQKTRPNSVHNRNSTLFLPSQQYLSLQDASVSFWRATQPVCASSNPWKPGTVT